MPGCRILGLFRIVLINFQYSRVLVVFIGIAVAYCIIFYEVELTVQDSMLKIVKSKQNV